MNEREQLAKDNGMTIEFVNWFFDNKKGGLGNVWFMMMAAMWEGWSGREGKCAALAAENAGLKSAIDTTIGWQQSTDPENVESVRMLFDIKTPSTDAFLAEVRASAVDEVCLKISNAIVNCYQDEQIGLDAAATICGDFAAKLRQGGAA